MKTRTIYSALFFFAVFFSFSAFAQNKQTISGVVTDSDNKPLSGVSVLVKGTNNGAATNEQGEYSLSAAAGDVLVFSSIDFVTQEVKVGQGKTYNVQLKSAKTTQLNEVVVTALGFQRKSKDLTYATQKISNSDLTTVQDPNFINSISGKVAGVSITKSASGLGGSSRVVLRGNKSTRENQPLYVVDGVPLANFNPSQPGDVWG